MQVGIKHESLFSFPLQGDSQQERAQTEEGDRVPSGPIHHGLLRIPKENETGWPVSLVICRLALNMNLCSHSLSRVIVNEKKHKLKKGTGFHLDLFIMGFLGYPEKMKQVVLSHK